jgi:hypothetical protein
MQAAVTTLMERCIEASFLNLRDRFGRRPHG